MAMATAPTPTPESTDARVRARILSAVILPPIKWSALVRTLSKIFKISVSAACDPRDAHSRPVQNVAHQSAPSTNRNFAATDQDLLSALINAAGGPPRIPRATLQE
jgi:hypothetical protein